MKRVDYKIGEIVTSEKPLTKYEIITNKIIEALENNTVPWTKPWTSLNPQNLFSKKEYRGINFILLSMIPTKYPYFATFKQVKDAGGSILKGSKSVPVYFYSPVIKREESRDGNQQEDQSYFLMKQYQVFTCEQMDGLDLSFHADNLIKDFKSDAMAEKIISNYSYSQGLNILPAQNACFSPRTDYIGMPQKENFNSEGAYYSTLFHELIHSTGHEKRLKRKGFGPKEYHSKKSEGYAFEELVAEFGSAMLSAHCGIDNRTEETQSTAYIKGWLEIFRQDHSIAYKAASKAQSAVDYVLRNSGFTQNELSEGQEAV